VSNPTSIGYQAEIYAEKYLVKQGLSFIERNFRSKTGEIDLIMCDKSSLIFIEVRYRKNACFGGALASVDKRKQHKLIKTAQYYLICHPKYAKMACQFDVVAIQGDFSTQPKLEWIKNAFGLAY
jgi:putative endonuclease